MNMVFSRKLLKLSFFVILFSFFIAEYGYTQTNTSSYNQSNTGSYNQNNTSSYNQNNTGSYNQNNTGSYNQNNTSSYNQNNTGSNTQSNTSSYNQNNTNSYNQNNTSSNTQSNPNSYIQSNSNSYTQGNLNSVKPGGIASIDLSSFGQNPFQYGSSLSDAERKQILNGLSSDQIAKLYNSLDAHQQQEMFSLLSNTQRRDLFQNLTGDEKKLIFNTLDDQSKADLFNLLGDQDRLLILQGLSNDEKSKLIKSLPPSEIQRWFEQYPDIMSGINLGILKPVQTTAEQTQYGEEEMPSRLEKIFSGQPQTEINQNLKQFGYDFFQGPGSFTPEQNVPVGPNYILGPGDNFTINLWGRVEETDNAAVSRDGTITLPRLGTMSVSGLTFSELKSFLLNKYKEYYTDFKMSITMGTLRTVDVYMIGEMKKPGTYNLSSLSTAVSALFAAGGPDKDGSLRNIKVLNNGKLIKTIDLYDFFINGSKADDVRLRQGYTVFVPVIGPVVGIAGQVKRPAIYEMKGKQTLGDIIKLAGGVLPTSHLQNVVIERVAGHKRRVVKSFNLDPSNVNSNENLKTVIHDGDLIKIFPIYNKMEEVVYLEGNVKYPREYELKKGMRVRDIIPSYNYLLPESYMPQAEIIRLVPPDLRPEIKVFNLGAMLKGVESQNPLLKNQDRIVIYNLSEKEQLPEVTISGAIRDPGTYRLYDKMTIKDLIFEAGNLTPGAYLAEGELTRMIYGSSGMNSIQIQFSPQKAISGNTENNLLLQNNDQVHIMEIPQYADSLERKVTLQGEFKFPGVYTFSQGERLSSVIKRAGGLTDEAYPYGAVFLRQSVMAVQQERKEEYVNRLEQDILSISAFAADTAVDPAQASVALQSLNAKKELLKDLRSSVPTGRMVINVSNVLLMPGGPDDLELRPGDQLMIGKRPDSVFVIGEVYNPNAMIYAPGKDVSYYLSLVGGMTSNADKKEIYIVRANGSVVSKKQSRLFGLITWSSNKHRWGFGSFDSIKIHPGDTIIVPKKIEQLGWLKLVKDSTSILYQIAVAAGVLHQFF